MKNQSLPIRIAAALLAALVLYTVLWFLIPFRTYRGYEAAMPADIDTEIQYPHLFTWKGSIRMFVNAYSALEIVPGVFGGYDLYAVFAGMSRDYRIALDGEMIPLEPINEECEILLDECRSHLQEYLNRAEDIWAF